MIITKCPTCGDEFIVHIEPEITGTYRLFECDNNHEIIVEITRRSGTTWTKDTFESDILPTLDQVEKISHPKEDITLYANPDDIQFKLN